MKKIVQLKDVEVGKCYKKDGMAIRIDLLDCDAEPVGAAVQSFSGHVEIWSNTDFLPLLYADDKVIEISKEAFEEKLEAAQKEFVKICNQIKKQL